MSAAEWESAGREKPVDGREPTSWAGVTLDQVSDDAGEPLPMSFARSDGVPLLYRGRINSIYGEPGQGKSWVAQIAALHALQAGETILYLDFEDSAKGVARRLRQLGATSEELSRLSYIKPDVGLASGNGGSVKHHPEAQADYAAACAGRGLVVIDGVNAALELHGWSMNSADDVNTFVRVVAHIGVEAGATVLTVDHVTKSRDERGTFAIGSQAKKAMTRGAAYSVYAKEPLVPGRVGVLVLVLHKDNAGQVTEHLQAGERIAAYITLDSDEAGNVEVSVDAAVVPCEDGADKALKRTWYLEQVSRWVEDNPRCSATEIRDGVKHKATYVREALATLVSQGYLSVTEVNRRRSHTVVTAYREADESEEERHVRAEVAAACPAPQGEDDHAALRDEVERQRRLREQDTPAVGAMVNGSGRGAMTPAVAEEWVAKLGEPGVEVGVAASCVDGPSGPVLRRALATAAGRGDERAERVLTLVDESAEF